MDRMLDDLGAQVGPATPGATTDFIACRRGSVGAAGENTAGAPLARPPHPMRAPRSPPEPAGLQNLLPSNIERWAIDRLIPYAKNARTHTDAQVGIASSPVAVSRPTAAVGSPAGPTSF